MLTVNDVRQLRERKAAADQARASGAFTQPTATRANQGRLHEQARAFRHWLLTGEVTGLSDAGFRVTEEEDHKGLPGKQTILELPRRLGLENRQSRAQSAFLETAGGYAAIGEEISDQIDLQLKFFAGVRKYATIVTTERGVPLLYPIVEDFDNEATEIAENTQVSQLDVEQFGSLLLGPRKLASKIIVIPYELLEDSPFALVDFLARVVGERCGRGANKLYTTMALTAAPAAVTTAAPAAITGDEIINTFYSVDAAYRDSPSAGWLMHSSMLKYVRELKDGSQRYLFYKNKDAGSPDTLMGKPVIPNYHMSSSPSASTPSMYFGDLSKVLIHDVGGVRLRRLYERYGDSDQVGLIAFLRTSAGILDAGGQPIQALMQHS
jgi:HK97 family phage major capsid protein